MKKLILSAAILAMGIMSANAQSSSEGKDLKFSVGLEAGLPMGDLKTSNNFGIGGSLQAEYKAAENIGLTLSAGYLSFSGKTFTFDGTSVKGPAIGIIPILVGGKYYFTESVYGGVQLGMSFLSATGVPSSSAFTYAPGIGYNVSPNFDLQLKYQAASKNGSTLSFLGLRAAYSF